MTSVKQLAIAYAWALNESTGPIYGSPEKAIEDAPYAKDAGLVLLKLFINEHGSIVHTEPVAS